MTDRQQVVDSITERICEVIPDIDEQLSEDRDLRDFPSFDSLGILETLVWLEDTFSLTIPDEELIVDHFDSISKMADYVLAHGRVDVT